MLGGENVFPKILPGFGIILRVNASSAIQIQLVPLYRWVKVNCMVEYVLNEMNAEVYTEFCEIWHGLSVWCEVSNLRQLKKSRRNALFGHGTRSREFASLQTCVNSFPPLTKQTLNVANLRSFPKVEPNSKSIDYYY